MFTLLASTLLVPQVVENRLPDDIVSLLSRARKFELVSVDPVSEAGSQGPYFGFRVLGRARIVPKADRSTLVKALLKSIRDARPESFLCFNPRHALHVEDDGRTLDVLVCFECWNGRYETNGSRGTFRATTFAEPVFDRFLKEAGVPLSPKPPLHGRHL